MSPPSRGVGVNKVNKTKSGHRVPPGGHFVFLIRFFFYVFIASPLLSRFDLVYLLLDQKNKEWDEMVSLYILSKLLICHHGKSKHNF